MWITRSNLFIASYCLVSCGIKKWWKPRLAYINGYVTDICIAETDVDMNLFGCRISSWMARRMPCGRRWTSCRDLVLDHFDIFSASMWACFGFKCCDWTWISLYVCLQPCLLRLSGGNLFWEDVVQGGVRSSNSGFECGGRACVGASVWTCSASFHRNV